MQPGRVADCVQASLPRPAGLIEAGQGASAIADHPALFLRALTLTLARQSQGQGMDVSTVLTRIASAATGSVSRISRRHHIMTKLAMIRSKSVPAKALTTQLKHALEMFDIRVVDHIIAGETASSFAWNGLL